jgi:hypothetical protein
MRQVQHALRRLGIPVFAGIWQPTPGNQHPPAQYAVYSATTAEVAPQDDRAAAYRTFVYLNLWSDIDPTDMARRIRAAMSDAGFAMIEETDKGYNEPAYESATRQYTVQWTWCWREEAPHGN